MFVSGLHLTGFRVQIETNGTLYRTGFPYSACKIVCSPKTPHINSALAPYIDVLKYVIESGNVGTDGLPTSVLGRSIIPARRPENCNAEIWVQPMDCGDDLQNIKHMQAAVSSVLTHGYRMCVQTHKILGLE